MFSFPFRTSDCVFGSFGCVRVDVTLYTDVSSLYADHGRYFSFNSVDSYSAYDPGEAGVSAGRRPAPESRQRGVEDGALTIGGAATGTRCR